MASAAASIGPSPWDIIGFTDECGKATSKAGTDLPMYVDSATLFAQVIGTITKAGLVLRSIGQTFLYEVIAPRKPLQQIFILNIIDRDMKMLIAAYEWSIVFELPIED